MTEHDFDYIMGILEEKDESETLEFKESIVNKEIGETAAAFSTSRGGKLLIGVSDKKVPMGINYASDLEDKICSIIRSCGDYPVDYIIQTIKFDQTKCIVEIDILRGEKPPYSYGGRYFKREKKSNIRLNATEIEKIKRDYSDVTFDALAAKSKQRSAHIGDIDEKKVEESIDEINEKRKKHLKKDARAFLQNNHLLVKDIRPTIASILLFGKDPIRFLPQSQVNMAVFPGVTITEPFSKYELKGTITEIIDQFQNLIERNTNHISYIKDFQRVDIYEYPYEVLREALINSLVHRDYFDNSSSIQIKVFKDRIEIINPGGLPYRGKDFEEIKQNFLSVKRNILLAEMMDMLGYMERTGRGIHTMIQGMKDHGLREPEFNVSKNSFKVTFYGPGENILELAEKSGKTTTLPFLNEKQQKILNELYGKQRITITTNEYEKEFNITKRQAQRDLKILFDKGLINRKEGTAGRQLIYTLK